MSRSNLIAHSILRGSAVYGYCRSLMIRCEINVLLHVNDQVNHLVRRKLCFFLQGQFLVAPQIGIVARNDERAYGSGYDRHNGQRYDHFYQSESFFSDTHSQPP